MGFWDLGIQGFKNSGIKGFRDKGFLWFQGIFRDFMGLKGYKWVLSGF